MATKKALLLRIKEQRDLLLRARALLQGGDASLLELNGSNWWSRWLADLDRELEAIDELLAPDSLLDLVPS